MAWETVTAVIAGVVGAGGIGGIAGTMATRKKAIAEARLTDGQLSGMVNNMLATQLERVTMSKERIESLYEDCKTKVAEAQSETRRLGWEHAQCDRQLRALQEEVRKLREGQ